MLRSPLRVCLFAIDGPVTQGGHGIEIGWIECNYNSNCLNRQMLFLADSVHGFSSPHFYPQFPLTPGYATWVTISNYDLPDWYAYVWDTASQAWVLLDHGGGQYALRLPFVNAPLSRSNFEVYDGGGSPTWTVPDTWYGWYYPLRLWDPQAPSDPNWLRWVVWSGSIPTYQTNGNCIEDYGAFWYRPFYTFHAYGPGTGCGEPPPVP